MRRGAVGRFDPQLVAELRHPIKIPGAIRRPQGHRTGPFPPHRAGCIRRAAPSPGQQVVRGKGSGTLVATEQGRAEPSARKGSQKRGRITDDQHPGTVAVGGGHSQTRRGQDGAHRRQPRRTRLGTAQAISPHRHWPDRRPQERADPDV